MEDYWEIDPFSQIVHLVTSLHGINDRVFIDHDKYIYKVSHMQPINLDIVIICLGLYLAKYLTVIF